MSPDGFKPESQRRSRWIERAYGVLLRAYPAEFRERYGQDASRTFARLHGDAASRGVLAVFALWKRTVLSVIVDGLRERRSNRMQSRRAGAAHVHGGRGEALVDAWRDARVALRSMQRRPGFAVTTVLLLGLGIGATTTMFSIVDGVLLRPLPYPEADRLVHLRKSTSSVPIPDYLDVSERVQSLEAMGAAWNVTFDLTGDGEPEQLRGAQVMGDFFSILGARAMRGRLFSEDDGRIGAARVAVVTSSLWLRRWRGDPSVIGRSYMVGGRPATIVGVLDPSFLGPEALGVDAAEIFVPLELTQQAASERNYFVLAVVARLRAGVTLEAARREMDGIGETLAETYPRAWRDRQGSLIRMEIEALRSATVSGIGRTLWLFLGAVVLMLLIACANVANLFLARATERSHEMALRSALGAGRSRIIRQLLTESVVLAWTGGALGVALAVGGLRLFAKLDPGGIPRLAEVGVDVRVLLFAAALSGLTGIVFGLLPALTASRPEGATVLRETGAATTAARTRNRLRNALIVAELGTAVVLLAGAGLLFGSFIRLQRVETGFQPESLLTFQLDMDSRVVPAKHLEFTNALLDRIRALPGVERVGASWRLPFDRGRCCWNNQVWSSSPAGDTIPMYFHPVTRDYFAALDVPMAEGRAFDDGDANVGVIPDDTDAQVPAWLPAIVSRSVIDRFWPGEPGVGRVLVFGRQQVTELHVVGVIDGVRHWRMDAGPGLDVYLPYASVAAWDIGLLDVGIRHRGPDTALRGQIRSAVREMDDALPIAAMASMEQRIARSIATPRFYAALLATFAGLAFLLAAGGVYGSMLYLVGLRRRELGIRVALGAARHDLVRHVVGGGAILVLTGTGLGLLVTIGIARVLRSLVFDISVTDPTTLLGAALALAAAGILACWIPAVRAARADPVATLRSG